LLFDVVFHQPRGQAYLNVLAEFVAVFYFTDKTFISYLQDQLVFFSALTLLVWSYDL